MKKMTYEEIISSETEKVEDWLKKSADFLMEQSTLHSGKPSSEQMAFALSSLAKTIGCDKLFLIKTEDDVTARVAFSLPEKYIGTILSPEWYEFSVDSNSPMIIDKIQPYKYSQKILMEDAKSFAILPINEQGFNGILFLSWSKKINKDSGLHTFLSVCSGYVRKTIQLNSIEIQWEMRRQRINAILLNISQGFIFIDDKSKKAFINGVSAIMLSIPMGEVPVEQVSAAMNELIATADNRDEISFQAVQLFANPNAEIHNWIWRFSKEQKSILKVSCIPIVFEKTEGRLWIFDDITEVQTLNEQQQKTVLELNQSNQLKNKLFTIISHDLRGPLSTIQQMFQILNIGLMEEEEKQLIFHELEKQTRITASTLDNLLHWARNQLNGVTEIYPEKTDLYHTAKQINELYETSALLKEIRIKNLVEPETIIFADPNILNLILRNLTANAIKFTRTGGKVTIKASKTENNMIEICISDTGVGMKKEIIEKLFRKDVLYTTTGTSNEKGTGIGLLLCLEYVEKHNGKIWVESEEGKGSHFKFTLPVNSFEH